MELAWVVFGNSLIGLIFVLYGVMVFFYCKQNRATVDEPETRAPNQDVGLIAAV